MDSILTVQLNLSPLKGVKFTDGSNGGGKTCHVTIRADDKAHEAEQQAYVGVAVEAVSACYLIVLAVKTAGLEHGRNELCAVSRKQHKVVWYNMLLTPDFFIDFFTRLSCASSFVLLHQRTFAQQPYRLL